MHNLEGFESGLAAVVALALLPALGNMAGGLFAEWRRPSAKTVNRALHAATGIILGVVAVEVMPRALGGAPAWLLAAALVVGGAAYLAIEAAISRWQGSREHGTGAGAWMAYVAVAADLAGDGLLVGAGTAVSVQLALAVALGQVLADVPEGFAVVANFRARGMGRSRRLWVSASFVLPVVAAAVIAYALLRNQAETLKLAALAFVAGLYLLAAVEDMLREAHESEEDTRWSAISLLAGFAVYLLVSGSLGTGGAP